MSVNVIKHDYKTTKIQREELHGHKAYLLWFTGLSGSGNLHWQIWLRLR